MTLLRVESLTKTFKGRRSRSGRRTEPIVAVDDVSFSVSPGETLALVGESGAGKSTVGRLVTRLIEPDSGHIVFDGVDLARLRGRELRAMRRELQMIFQDPYSSLDPRVTVGASVAEPLLVHEHLGTGDRMARAASSLERVGLDRGYLDRYPRELSGGQRQRACIARALILHPKLIVCDEPTAALDVSVQAQVLNLMRDLQDEFGLSYVFISHDLALVESIADRVAVMADHRIVEIDTTEQIFASPESEYTRALLDAIPVPVPKSLRTGAAPIAPTI